MLMDISEAKLKVIAFSFLSDEEHEKLIEQVNNRFLTGSYVMLRVSPEMQHREMLRHLSEELVNCKINALTNTNYIIALFLDFTDESLPGQLEKILAIPEKVRNFAGGIPQLILQFGFCGMVKLDDLRTPRECARNVVKANIQANMWVRKLFLVSQPAIGTHAYWKEQVLLLDMLRRSVSHHQLMPPTGENENDDIGYLSYSEYSAAGIDEIQSCLERLTAVLNGKTCGKFADKIAQELAEIYDRIKDISPNAAYQPQHMDMLIEESFLNKKRKKARKGELPTYNFARNSTETAAGMTVSVMEEAILREYQVSADTIAGEIMEFLAESEVSLDQRENKSGLYNCLNMDDVNKTDKANLIYDEQGCETLLSHWFQRRRDEAVAKGKNLFREKIRSAIEQITADDLLEEKRRVNHEISDLKSSLKDQQPLEVLCHDVANGHVLKECSFEAETADGQGRSYILIDDTKMQVQNQPVVDFVEGKLLGTDAETLTIEGANDIADPEHGKVKALRVMILNYDEAGLAIDELLPEGEE